MLMRMPSFTMRVPVMAMRPPALALRTFVVVFVFAQVAPTLVAMPVAPALVDVPDATTFVGVPVAPLVVGAPVALLTVGVPLAPLVVGVPLAPLAVGMPVALLLPAIPNPSTPVRLRPKRMIKPTTKAMIMSANPSPAIPMLVVLVLHHNSRLSHPASRRTSLGRQFRRSYPAQHPLNEHVRHEHAHTAADRRRAARCSRSPQPPAPATASNRTYP